MEEEIQDAKDFLYDLIEQAKKLPTDYMTQLYAHIDQAVIITQKKMEETVGAIKLAYDIKADTEMEYQKKYGKRTKHYANKKEDVSSSLVKAIAEGESAEEKRTLNMAWADINHLNKLFEAYRERENALKFIGRGMGKFAGDKERR